MTRLRKAGGETFRSFHVRNFRLFFGGQLISQIGNWLTLVAQALLVLQITDNGAALGLLAAAQFGPVLFFGAFAGLIADRADKRRLLIGVQTFAMLQSFALAAIAFMPSPSLLAIYGVALLGGFATALDNPVRRSFVVELVPAEDINNAVSLNTALMTGARIVGPALAGLLITTLGFGWAFAIDGFSYLAVLAGLWLMNPAEIRKAPVTPRGKGQVREGLRYIRSVPDLLIPLIMAAIVGTLAFNFQTVLPLFAIRDLDGTDLTFTLLMSVISIGSFAGALATARRTSIRIGVVAWAALAYGIAMGFLAIAPGVPAAFAISAFVGLTSVVFMTSSTAIVQLRADPMMRGRVLAIQAIVFIGSTPIGGPILGVICEQYGARYGLALGALACIGAAVYGFAAVRRQHAEHPERLVTADGGQLELATRSTRP